MDLLNLSIKITSDIKSEIDDSYLKIDTKNKTVESIGNDPLVQDTLIKLADKFKGEFESDTKFKYTGEFKSSNLGVLSKLPIYILKDRVWFFKNRLVENLLQDPNCPVEVMDRMVKDANLIWRVLRNPNCPVEILERLSDDDRLSARALVALNPNCPVEVLEKLSDDPHPGVMENVARNPNCPVEIRDRILSR